VVAMPNQTTRLYVLAWALVLIGLVFALGYLSGNLPWDKFLN